MKKVIYSLALVSLLTLSSTASAQETNVRLKARASTSAEIRMDLKARVDARKASTTEMRDERRASTTAKRIEVQQNIAKRQVERAGRVLAATIEHLENILARVESRIAKVKADGGATAESEGFVAEVKTHLSEAKASLAAFASIEITSDKASENFQAVREAASGVKKHLREAHRSLMNAIRTLKPGRSNGNATSTNATSTSQ